MPPTPSRMMFTCTCSCGSRAISSASASSEPATSALSDEVELLLAALGAGEHVLERDAAAALARERLLLDADRRARWPARCASRSFSTTRKCLAGVGHAVEAEHLDRHAGRGLLDAPGRGSRASRARGPSARRPRARRRPSCGRGGSSSVTTGPRPGSSRDSITNPDASASGLALQLLDLGERDERLEQVVEVLRASWPTRRRTRCRRPSRRA